MSVTFFTNTDEMVWVPCILDGVDQGWEEKKHEINVTASNAMRVGRNIGWQFEDEEGTVSGYVCAETQIDDFIATLKEGLSRSQSFPVRSTYIETILPHFIALGEHAKAHGEHIYYY